MPKQSPPLTTRRDIDPDDDVDAWGNENEVPHLGGIVHDVLHALVVAKTGVAVDVSVIGDCAILIRGEAPSDEVRSRIEQVARGVDGVEQVINEVTVALRTVTPRADIGMDER